MTHKQSAMITGLIFATVYFVLALDYLGPLYAALTALIPGLIFGALPYVMDHPTLNKKQITKHTQGKEVLFMGEATYSNQKDFWANEGVLYLTSDQLIFRSNRMNFKRYHLFIDLQEIEDLEEYEAKSLLQTTLLIVQKDGKRFYFGAYNRNEWLQKIRKVRFD